jgi:hypothetical protein
MNPAGVVLLIAPGETRGTERAYTIGASPQGLNK